MSTCSVVPWLPLLKQRSLRSTRGDSVPQAGHVAIAELVRAGYVRVVLTTNFDRLLEGALEAAGIAPSVISTPHAADGAMPLAHEQCTVIKLHGDYLDLRLKNTPLELATYDPRIDRLLDRILDEFGLIVCGWSGEWDTALRNAMERVSSHRFTTYWAARAQPRGRAADLVSLRRAQWIQIQDADSFFRGLLEKIRSIENLASRHPVSGAIAVASLKRHIVRDDGRIAVHDLVMDDVERVYGAILPELSREVVDSRTKLTERIHYYEELCRSLCTLVGHGAFWGTHDHLALWEAVIHRLATHPAATNARYSVIVTPMYPALLVLYAGGIGAIAGRRLSNLYAIARASMQSSSELRLGHPLSCGLVPPKVLEGPAAQAIRPVRGNYATPLSDQLYDYLREPLRGLIASDETYETCFDTFELLNALSYADLRNRRDTRELSNQRTADWVLPPGRWTWRRGAKNLSDGLLGGNALARAATEAGLFDGSVERFNEVSAGVAAQVARHRREMLWG